MEQVLGGQVVPHHLPHDGQDDRARMLEVPRPLPLGTAESVVELDAPAELSEHRFQRGTRRPPRVFRRKPRQRQRRLGQAEIAGGLAVVQQAVEVANLQPRALVDRGDPHERLLDDAGVGLDGRLAVEIDGGVDNAAAMLQGVGRRVGPAAAQVQPSRGTAPDDLVLAERAGRRRRRRHRWK